MGFQINTNIASLQAQEYLRMNGDFQTKTISRVTSGMRITASGDDAAGLAIANSFRSDIAMLSQGIRNANDGLSTLQTIDGGINNISKLLDRARTLATQSASGTFVGNRSVLNQEFQSVVTEINRQAQAIGMDSGGQYAKMLTTFIGGGKTNGGVNEIANGSVSVDLSNAKVDARSLGLSGLEAAGLDAVDLSDSSATSVQKIVNNSGNIASAGDQFDFLFYGPGFGDSDRVKVSVNRAGVTNMATLTAAVNGAIESAGNGTSAAATAFKNAGIKAVVKTDSDGSQRIAFTSAQTAFQVRAGDQMANAILGNVTSSSNPTGKSLVSTVTGGAASATGAFNIDVDKIVVRFQGGGLTAPVDITIDTTSTSYDTAEEAVAYLSSQVSQNAALQAAGITMTGATAGSALQFTNAYGERFEVLASGDLENRLGLGSYRLSSIGTGDFEYSTITGAGAALTGVESATFQIALSGESSASVSVPVGTPADVADAVQLLNAAFLGDAEARAAQLVAANDGGEIRISSQNGTLFRLNVHAANAAHVAAFGFGGAAATTASAANAQGGAGLTTTNTFYSGGASMVEATDNHALAFNAIRYATDDQTLTVSLADVNGIEKSKVVTLKMDGLTGSARSGITIDEAVREINRVLQSSNDPDFQKIVAVKERIGNTEEGIRFLSGAKSFKVSLGATANGMGLVDKVSTVATQSRVVGSELSEGGANLAIDTQEAAQTAVGSLLTAVSLLGQAQAAVGKGQNQYTFAVNLAQSQVTNIAAAESRIRDADLALEAANMTKAQIMLQAGIAALAQANSAPQAVLALLRG